MSKIFFFLLKKMAAVKLSQEVHDLFIFQMLESCVTPGK